MIIFPGETGTYEFIIPFPSDVLSKGVVSFRQTNIVTLELTSSTFETLDDTTCILKCPITQAESLKIKPTVACKIQVNLYTNGGNRIVSTPIDSLVGEQFHRTVIV